MSQITHEEARRLINISADQSLDANVDAILDSHLNGCAECRKYASEIGELENILREMKHSLNLRPAPLHLDQIMYRSKNMEFGFLNRTMVTRISTAAAAFIAMAIVAWQFLSASVSAPAIPYTAIPIPTPSTYYVTSTNTDIMLPNCNYVPYQVKTGETLDSIALQFSVSREIIMDFNGIKEEEIKPDMQIRIPTCNHTPTVTSEVSNSTMTITPQSKPITLTPG